MSRRHNRSRTHTIAMLWFKEVAVAKSVDDLMTSQSLEGCDFPARCHILQGHMAPHKNSEKTCPSQGVIQKCEPQERKTCAPKSEDRTLQETLQQERCAEKHSTWRKNVCKLKTRDKATFHAPTEAWVMHPLRTSLRSDLDDDVQDFDTRWDQALLAASEIPT